MTTTRTPVRPQHKLRITPEVIVAFRRMERARARCTCPPVDYEREDWAEQSVDQCVACRRWWNAHSVLHSELRLPPWQWPAFHYPDEGGRDELYEALAAASKAAGQASATK